MSTLKFIKSFKDNNITMLQVLSSYVFGGVTPSPYDSTKNYMEKDVILSKDAVTGRIDFLRAKEDNVTGAFDVSKWSVMTINDFVKDSSSGVETNHLTTIEDMVTLISMLTSHIPKPLTLNHIYADDMVGTISVNINKGLQRPGSLII